MPDRRPPRARSAQRPAERGRRSDPVRLAAYTVMRAVADGAYANLELPKALRGKRIDGRDAAFATELVYGATRMRGFYDRVVEVAARRPVDEIDGPVLDTLRLGVHQLLGMRVATHAAVDETVALARQVNGIGASGFVNAVLRRVAERDRETWLAEVAPPELEPLAALAVRTSHPEWVVRAMRQALLGHGTATAEDADAQLAALLAADNAPPRVTLAARPGLADVGELLGDGATLGALARTAVVLDHGDPGGLPRRARRTSRGPGRGVAAGRPGPGRRTGRAAVGSGALARPLRRTRRQGRAARGPGPGARRRPRRQRGEPEPHRAGPADPGGGGRARPPGSGHRPHRRRPGGRRGRARRVRPGARGRTLHRPRRVAAPPGGPLATPAVRRAHAGDPAARAADQRAGRHPARRRRGVRDVQPAPRGDPVRGLGRRQAAVRRRAGGRRPRS